MTTQLLVTIAALTAAAAQLEMFSASQSYERFMGRWSRELAARFVTLAGIHDGDAILDVGSGTGALAAAAGAAAPASRIVGIDPSAPYLAFARARLPESRFRFETGDAQRLQFEDATFDRTMSMLVLNFIPDRSRALAEMIRVTRPGGTVAAAVWDYGAGMEMLRIFWDEATALDPGADRLDERHMPLCRSGELAALWRSQGLQQVREDALTIETRFATFEDYWAPFLEKQGPAGAYVAALPLERRTALGRRLRQRLVGEGADRPIVLRARAWAVVGTRP